MPVRHGGDDRVFVFEIAIDQTDADPGLGTDIVHAGLMKTAFGEANHGRLEDLVRAIRGRFVLGLRHKVEKMNERSFIVNSPSLKVT